MKTIDEAELRKMYEEKQTLYDIAEHFGICVVTLSKKLKQLGLSRVNATDFTDITGQRFGRLVALSPVRKDRFGKYIWKVRCDCGKEKEINSSGMKAGIVVSCGCLRKENCWKGFGDISGSYWHKLYKSAIQRGFPFEVTKEYAWEIFIQQEKKCALSGVPLIMFPNNDKYSLQTASLDRIDSDLGYVVGNIQWVHKRVNFLKRDYSEKELLFWCNAISQKSPLRLGDFKFESIEREKRPLNENTKTVQA